MSQVLITESNLENIADAIREKTNTTDTYNVTEMAEAIKNIVGGTGADSVPIGVIVPYASETPPPDWLICDGSEVSREEYKDLFRVIGTSYGAGDGSTTFNLPNKKGKVSVGLDTSDSDFNTIGKTGGEKKHTLTTNELPSMSFTTGHIAYSDSLWTGTNISHTLSYGKGAEGTKDTAPRENLNLGYQHEYKWGQNQAHNNLQPYQVDNWIIKATQNKDIADVMPIGTVVDYEGVEIPEGWEEAGSDDYSLEETFTGKYWVDGKKIYKKVVRYTTTSTIGATGTTTSITIPHGITNFNETIDYMARRGNNKLPVIGGWSAIDRTTYVEEVSGTYIYLKIVNDNWSAGNTFTFILEYTKTTD